jgi:lipopolysaccharide biosynthesis regulator YciM
VTGLVDGKKVVAPSASAPEMKFAVLSTVDFQELSRLKKSNSHLALGVFYARVGLLNEAEREFEHLVELNPQSELSRKLLQSVRTIKKPT